MTGIVSLGGLCSPALWMSRFVLPHGGPQLLLFRSLFPCIQCFNGALSKPLDVTCVVISGSLWVPTYQDFPCSLYNSGAAHYDGRPPWWSPLLSSEFPCLVPVNVCRHLQAPPQHQPTATLKPWETFIPPPWNMAAFSQREGDRQNPRNSSTVGLLLRHMSRTQTFPSAPTSQIVTYMVNIDSHTPRRNYWNYYHHDTGFFLISTEGALRRTMTYDNHSIPSHQSDI